MDWKSKTIHVELILSIQHNKHHCTHCFILNNVIMFFILLFAKLYNIKSLSNNFRKIRSYYDL